MGALGPGAARGPLFLGPEGGILDTYRFDPPPWGSCATPVGTSLLDSLWLPPGGPNSDSFLTHFGGGLGTHFGADLERLKYPGK